MPVHPHPAMPPNTRKLLRAAANVLAEAAGFDGRPLPETLRVRLFRISQQLTRLLARPAR